MNDKQMVSAYFEDIEKYAFGDLDLFHQLAANAEVEEGPIITTTDSEGTRYHPGSYGAEPFPELEDLRKPIEVVNRATIPFTLMMFSCMDTLGYLVRTGEGAESGAAHKDTGKNIGSFLKFVSPAPIDLEIECLIAVYRNGLVHNYFPKLSHAISYHSENSKEKLFFLDPIGVRIVLNVNRLEYYLKSGFENIMASESLFDKIAERLKRMNADYEKKDAPKIEKLIRLQQGIIGSSFS
jgi:hypothetical protein